MTNETELNRLEGKILSQSGEEIPCWISFKEWSDRERRQRAFKRTGKIVGGVFAVSLIGLFVHILLIVIIPTLILTLALTAPIFFRLLNERVTFFYVEGRCPWCKKETKLKPYLNTALTPQVTAQCSECGQTCQVVSTIQIESA